MSPIRRPRNRKETVLSTAAFVPIPVRLGLKLRPVELATYFAVRSRWFGPGTECWPSYEDISERGNVARGSVSAYLKGLREKGALKVERRGRRSYYTFPMEPTRLKLGEVSAYKQAGNYAEKQAAKYIPSMKRKLSNEDSALVRGFAGTVSGDGEAAGWEGVWAEAAQFYGYHVPDAHDERERGAMKGTIGRYNEATVDACIWEFFRQGDEKGLKDRHVFQFIGQIQDLIECLPQRKAPKKGKWEFVFDKDKQAGRYVELAS